MSRTPDRRRVSAMVEGQRSAASAFKLRGSALVGASSDTVPIALSGGSAYTVEPAPEGASSVESEACGRRVRADELEPCGQRPFARARSLAGCLGTEQTSASSCEITAETGRGHVRAGGAVKRNWRLFARVRVTRA